VCTGPDGRNITKYIYICVLCVSTLSRYILTTRLYKVSRVKSPSSNKCCKRREPLKETTKKKKSYCFLGKRRQTKTKKQNNKRSAARVLYARNMINRFPEINRGISTYCNDIKRYTRRCSRVYTGRSRSNDCRGAAKSKANRTRKLIFDLAARLNDSIRLKRKSGLHLVDFNDSIIVARLKSIVQTTRRSKSIYTVDILYSAQVLKIIIYKIQNGY